MRRSETLAQSDLRCRVLPADRVGAAGAVERSAVAGPTTPTVVSICLVAGIAAALLSADLAWSHRAAVAATVAFGLAIALQHARPDRAHWWLAGAVAVVMAGVGSRVDLLDGAEPAWMLWAAALAVAVSSARPLDAQTNSVDARNVMVMIVAALVSCQADSPSNSVVVTAAQ